MSCYCQTRKFRGMQKVCQALCQFPHDTNGVSHRVNHMADLQQSCVKRGHFMEARALSNIQLDCM